MSPKEYTHSTDMVAHVEEARDSTFQEKPKTKGEDIRNDAAVNVAGYTKKAVTASGLFLGCCVGNIIGPLVFKSSDAPVYGPGFTTVLITSVVAGVLAFCYRCLCIWENARRDRDGQLEGYDNAYDDDITDMKNLQFRYSI